MRSIYKKAKTVDKYKKKTLLNGDVLVVDIMRYSVDSLHKLPQELNLRQFSEKNRWYLPGVWWCP